MAAFLRKCEDGLNAGMVTEEVLIGEKTEHAQLFFSA